MGNEEFLRPRIRVVLSTVGFNEKYQAFEYMVEMIFDMCKHEPCIENYNEVVERLCQKNHIAPISITGQIGILIIQNKELCQKLNLTKMRNFQRLKTLSGFVQEKINTMFVN